MPSWCTLGIEEALWRQTHSIGLEFTFALEFTIHEFLNWWFVDLISGREGEG